MKKIIFLLIGFLSQINYIFAESGSTDTGILSGSGITQEKLRKGDINMDDIPNIISGSIDYLMGFAGTIAIIFIIIGAYQLAIGSFNQDKNKGRTTIIMALSGFALSSLAWIILKSIIDNFA